jgi:hypothetical protein
MIHTGRSTATLTRRKGKELYFQLPKDWLLVDDGTIDSLMFLCPEHAKQWWDLHNLTSPEPPTPPEPPSSGPIESTNRFLRWLKSRRTKPSWVPKTCPRCKHPDSIKHDTQIAWCQQCSWAWVPVEDRTQS